MNRPTTSPLALASKTGMQTAVEASWEAVGESFEQFCLIAGLSSLTQMMDEGARALSGEPHARDGDKPGYCWGRMTGRLGFHGGKVELERPRIPFEDHGQGAVASSRTETSAAGWLEQWAMNLMLINVSTRKFGRAVRLPEAGVSAQAGSGLSKSAVSRRFKALRRSSPSRWPPICRSAVAVDVEGRKHPLGVVEGATEKAATVQALLDNLIERGLDPAVCRLFIVNGAKALTKAIRRTLGPTFRSNGARCTRPATPPTGVDPKLHAAVRRALRQAWEMDDAAKAEHLLRKLARRLELDAPGVSKSILEGLGEIPTLTRLGLRLELRRSLTSTNIIESMKAVIRQVCLDAKMALRWTAAGMLEAAKGFRRLKAHKQLPILKASWGRMRFQASDSQH